MTEDEFKALCEECDNILVSSDTTLERVAVSWLHIIREHPVFLENYENLFNPSQVSKENRRGLTRKIQRVVSEVKLLVNSIMSHGQKVSNLCNDSGNVDVLFVSHLINESQIGNSTDFYYGDLPKDLANKGYSVVVALIDHTHSLRKTATSSWTADNVPRVLLPRFSGLLDEIDFKRSLISESKKLRKLAKTLDAGLRQRVILWAAGQATSNGNSANLRIAHFIGELNSVLQPKLMLVTHEGHAWERLAFAAARTANPKVYCAGYQHAALFRLQHAIRRNLAPQYNPDMLLTSGFVAKRQMEQSNGGKRTPIAVVGSHRGSRTIDAPSSLRGPITCLVLPEGIEGECNLLFEFSLECAYAMPNVNFIWRLHPLVNFELLASRNPKLQNLPDNISISKSTLSGDASNSRFALYRGTTAIVSMVMMGLRPIYLKVPGEMTIDPLYELHQWKAVVSSVAEFGRSVAVGGSLSNKDEEFERVCAQKYCQEFYSPINSNVLERLLQDIEKVDQ